ncbi:MAG: ABC transporter permease [Candidatus Bathyarchaeia archaeon]
MSIFKEKERVELFLLDQLAWILVVLVYISFAVIKPTAMLNPATLHFLIYSSVPIGFLVLAESMTLFTGNFDLSIAEQAGLIGMASGVILMRLPESSWLTPILCVLLPIIFGILCGSLNGALIGKAGLNPFLVTMGTMVAFDGLTMLIRPQSIWARDLPKFFISIGANEVTSIIIFVLILLCVWFFLKYIRSGVYLYAVGSDRETSRMFGINVENTIFMAYMLSGVFCGVSALFYVGFNKGVPMNMAGGALFPAFAGAVIGGVSLAGGRGSVVSAFAGSLLIGTLEAGLTMFAISPDARKVAFGILVVSAIVIDRFRTRLRDRILRPK